MSRSNKECEAILQPFVDAYVQTLNAAKFDDMVQFYDKNSVMIEKDKSCLYGQENIKNSLEQMCVECGKTVMTLADSSYEGAGDFINLSTKFEFHTEKAGVLKGRFLQIWRKDGDKYTIYHDEYEML